MKLNQPNQSRLSLHFAVATGWSLTALEKYSHCLSSFLNHADKKWKGIILCEITKLAVLCF